MNETSGTSTVSQAHSDTGAAPARPRGRWLGPILWLSLPVVAVDQVTKAVIRSTLPLHASQTVVPGFLDFTHVQNTGAAFGLFGAADFPFKATVIAFIATVALIGIAAYAAKLSPHQRVARIGLALVMGGATGNLIDRLTTGYVIDFVDAYWRGYHFWAFNVADSAITIGVATMMLDMVCLGRHAPKAA